MFVNVYYDGVSGVVVRDCFLVFFKSFVYSPVCFTYVNPVTSPARNTVYLTVFPVVFKSWLLAYVPNLYP